MRVSIHTEKCSIITAKVFWENFVLFYPIHFLCIFLEDSGAYSMVRQVRQLSCPNILVNPIASRGGRLHPPHRLCLTLNIPWLRPWECISKFLYDQQICFFSSVLPVMMKMDIVWKAKLKISVFATWDGKVIAVMTAVLIGNVRKQTAQLLVNCQMNAGAPQLQRHLTPQACVTFLYLSRHHRL